MAGAFALFSDLSEPVKQYLLPRYDLRSYSSEDRIQRTQTIAVHNEGSKSSPPILVDVELERETPGAITHFTASSFASTPKASFLDAVSRSDSFREKLSGRGEELLRAVDQHFDSGGLSEVDNALLRELQRKLAAGGAKPPQIVEFLRQPQSGFESHPLRHSAAGRIPGASP